MYYSRSRCWDAGTLRVVMPRRNRSILTLADIDCLDRARVLPNNTRDGLNADRISLHACLYSQEHGVSPLKHRPAPGLPFCSFRTFSLRISLPYPVLSARTRREELVQRERSGTTPPLGIFLRTSSPPDTKSAHFCTGRIPCDHPGGFAIPEDLRFAHPAGRRTTRAEKVLRGTVTIVG